VTAACHLNEHLIHHRRPVTGVAAVETVVVVVAVPLYDEDRGSSDPASSTLTMMM
jgi:hypothetical protein